MHSSEFQERLFTQISTKKEKTEFSPSEIYQFVDPKKKRARILSDKAYSSKENFEDFVNNLKSATSQILFFSGNLTFSNMGSHDKKIRSVVEELAERGVSSKVLTRVELAGIDNINNLSAINKRIGKNMVEVRHCYQPLRLTIIDNKLATFKETLDPKYYAKGELKEKELI